MYVLMDDIFLTFLISETIRRHSNSFWTFVLYICTLFAIVTHMLQHDIFSYIVYDIASCSKYASNIMKHLNTF